MVTRQRKMLAAGLVLVVGFGLAWPLRRTEPLGPGPMLAYSAPTPQPQALKEPAKIDPLAAPEIPITVNTPISSTLAPPEPATDPFAAVPGPIYSTISDGAGQPASAAEAKPAERIHIVHQGDSLDRLANRYLGDEARALEIFDLNREVLDNPHILPIGVELRLPPAPPNGATP